jgi:SCY1-like protein 1
LTIIGKLSDRTINGELLKYLAKTSNDEQPGIRTNTTICLGKISKNLGVGSRSKILIAAFTRSLRDPFVHARNAALMALAVTPDFFSEDECASKILPSLCPCLVDKEKLVRDQATKTMDMYLTKVRKFASTMPDSVLPPPTAAEATATAPRMSTPQPSEAASWAGWAISSFTNKISTAAGEIEPASNGTPALESRPGSAPVPNDVRRPVAGSASASASALHRQAVTSPTATSARTSTSSNQNDYFQESNTADDDMDAWPDMQDEAFFDAPSQAPKVAPSAANPFGDEGEPDFAGWLAAQAGKKPGSKPLPKGLAKSSAPNASRPATAARVVSTGSVATKKAPLASLKPKPVVAKKVDTAPKATDNDEGWGDGW